MTKKKSKEGIQVKKSENFSEWYSQIIEKAEIVDIRTGVKGFIVVRPWGTLLIEKMYDFYEEELQRKNHKPTIMPSVIPESNLKKESSHIEGFTPEVFWIKTEKGEEKLALRPTSETLYTPMFKLWIRSWRDLPMKLYQRGSVFRLDTKATRPLIRGREFQWIETHNAFATKAEAEAQVQEDIQTTEKIMHQCFGVPFLPMKRPSWDKFAGAEYTIGSDVIMPDGKLIQQPSTHLMGQKFSKAFDATFKNKKDELEYLWTTAYGPAISRILVSVISTHGDDKGLVLPFSISPTQIVIVPIYNNKNKEKIIKYSEKIKKELEDFRIEIDLRESYSPGWKFNEWELKGVPFRIEIGEKEMKSKNITFFTRDTGKKQVLSLKEISNLEKRGKDFDERLRKKAEKFLKEKIVDSKTKEELKKNLSSGKIARINFCSTDEKGISCAGKIEKEIKADVRGTLANEKEKPFGNKKCLICNKSAKEVVYVGKSY
jgi:prolyl-tRNA synthetase